MTSGLYARHPEEPKKVTHWPASDINDFIKIAIYLKNQLNLSRLMKLKVE